MEDKNHIQIADLNLSASLISVGFKLLDVDRTDPHKVTFIFQHDQKIHKAIADYWDFELTVSARKLLENIRMLKTRIFQGV